MLKKIYKRLLMPLVRRRAHKQLLTPLVRRKVKIARKYVKVPFGRRSEKELVWLFDLWVRIKKVEYLPEGVPYKISGIEIVRECGGLFIPGLNKPLILVSDLFDPAERKNAARHELEEYKRSTKKHRKEAHEAAAKRDNPRLRKNTKEKAGNFELEKFLRNY